jgi:glycosyltransferase involved in cell wall biosynthesis
MPGKPLVTVLMSVFNDAPYLRESVESILAQSLQDFEFLVIDDGSTDGSREFLRRARDERLRVLRNPCNLGLTRSLNRGLNVAAGSFVARMDADDVAASDRLTRQVEFLRKHPEVGIVGSSRILIDAEGRDVAHVPAPQDHLRIRWKCLLGNPFTHPAVMLRKGVLDAHRLRYDEAFRTAQDYEMWSRLLAVTRGANLREPLLRYRLRDGVSRVHKEEQLRNHDCIATAAIRRFVPGITVTEQEVAELRGRFGGYSVRDSRMDVSDRKWREKYLDLLQRFVAAHPAEPDVAAFYAEWREAIEGQVGLAA